MPPELLTALYAAGFPMTRPNGTRPIPVLSRDPHEVSTNLYEPTLEELIEACGEGFGKLELCSCMLAPHDHAAIWDARPKDENINGEHADKWAGRGENPKETVANLYIALHAK